MPGEAILGALAEAVFQIIADAVIEPVLNRGLAMKDRKEIRDLVHAAATDTLTPKQEKRLRTVLRRQGQSVDELSHDELVRVAQKSEALADQMATVRPRGPP